MPDIFLSYNREDQAAARRFAEAFKAQGFDVWWDTTLRAGEAYDEVTETALRTAKAVVVLWSKKSVASRWVRAEASIGQEHKHLAPVKIEACDLPVMFRLVQTAELSHWKGEAKDPAWLAFLSDVRKFVEQDAPSPPPETRSAASAPSTTRTLLRRPLVLVGLAAAGIALIAALAATLLWPRGDAPAATGLVQSLSAPPRIAVSPVNATGGGDMLTAMAQTLREDVASGLSRFSMIAVAAPGDESVAEYRLDSSLLQSGDAVRLTARLINTDTNKQIWGESWDRAISETTAFSLQDDLTDHLVASVADANGALMRDLQAPVAQKSSDEMAPYEAVVRNSIYLQRVSAEEHLISRTALRRAVELDPNNANVWAALSGISIDEIKHDFNVEPGAADQALQQARRAVALDPDNAYAHFALAEAHFFRRELGPFEAARGRALELNPRDTRSVAMLGVLSGYAGDWKLGVDLTQRAMSLNPNHPGWYRFTMLFNEYRQGNYEAALKISNAINMPDYFADPYTRAMILGQLGRRDEAAASLGEFRALWGGDMEQFKRVALKGWIWAQPDLQAHVIEGLQKAGLDIVGDGKAAAARDAPEKSGESVR